MLLDSLPLESFKMTGVSFEGRQDLVSQLQPGKTVAKVLVTVRAVAGCVQHPKHAPHLAPHAAVIMHWHQHSTYDL